MGVFEAIMGILSAGEALADLVNKLAERGRQTGELTPEQSAVLAERQALLASKYNTAPPPPAGV